MASSSLCTVIPNYSYGRRKGLKDEESETIVYKAVNSAINVLEKQIFVQPSDVEFAEILGYKTGMCVCGEELVEYETYCWNCGQKINWN